MYYLGIEAFLVIVQAGNLAGAAEILCVTPATISHRLKSLEQELGVELLERQKGTRTVKLTPLGEDFVDIAERWSTLSRDTEQFKAGKAELALSIGSVDSLNVYVFPALYRALSRHTPALSLTISTHQTGELYDLVQNKKIDVAFVLRELLVPNIVIEPLFSDKMVVLRLDSPENSCKQTVEPQELDEAHELFNNWGSDYEAWHNRLWDPFCAQRIRLDTVPLISNLLVEPRQWAIVPQAIAAFYQASKRFCVQHLVEPPPDWICYMISHRYKRSSTMSSLAILNQYLPHTVEPFKKR